MKALNRYLIAIAFVLALSYIGLAHGQDAPGAAIDARDAAQEKAIGENAAALAAHEQEAAAALSAVQTENASQAARIEAVESFLKTLSNDLADLAERVEALESGATGPGEPTDPTDPTDPEEPTDPDPVALPWPVTVYDLDILTHRAFETNTLAVTGKRVTVQAGNHEGEGVAAPVVFYVNGERCAKENNNPYRACGDASPAPFNPGLNTVTIEAADGKTATVTVDFTEGEPVKPQDPATPPPIVLEPQEPRALMQANPWYPWASNIEDYFINHLRGSSNKWYAGSKDPKALMDEGYVDAATGYPLKWPGAPMRIGGYFSGTPGSEYDGEWVLEWECEGGGAACASMSVGFQGAGDDVRNAGPGRIEFTRDAGKNASLGFYFTVDKLDAPLTRLAVFRKENEAEYRAGNIYSPRFLKAVEGYDIIRMMDPQQANQALITDISQEPPLNSIFWANRSWAQAEFRQEFEAMPLAAVFAMHRESGKALWVHAPETLGAPKRIWDLKPDNSSFGEWTTAGRAMAKEHAHEILASDAWDSYADALVKALIESGYPADMPLYLTIGNEVWNWATQYHFGTNYAAGLFEGLPEFAHINGLYERNGYGILISRLKLAVDAALERAGRDQVIEYVIEGQMGSYSNMNAVRMAKAWLEAQGEKWEDHAPEFGLSVTSYWAAEWRDFVATPEELKAYKDADALPADERDPIKAVLKAEWESRWKERIAADPDGTAKEFADFILTSQTFAGLEWLKYEYADMIAKAGLPYGVKFTGAYEGGTGLLRPDYIPVDWYTDFIWGEEGARVNYELTVALASYFPGMVLSNYHIAGPVGTYPFPEGPLGCTNPYCESWNKIMDAVGEQ